MDLPQYARSVEIRPAQLVNYKISYRTAELVDEAHSGLWQIHIQDSGMQIHRRRLVQPHTTHVYIIDIMSAREIQPCNLTTHYNDLPDHFLTFVSLACLWVHVEMSSSDILITSSEFTPTYYAWFSSIKEVIYPHLFYTSSQ